MKSILNRLAHWWIDRQISRDAAERSAPGMEWKRLEFDETGLTANGTSPAIAWLAADAIAMLEANNAQNYVQFDMLGRAGTPPVRVTVQWAHGVSPALKASEMQEALRDMVNQHCQEDDGLLFDWALSANEDALEVLQRYGQVTMMPRNRFAWVKEAV